VRDGRHPSPQTIPAILARLAAHDIDGALQIAERRLRASACPPRVEIRQRALRDPRPLAAALVLPLPRSVERAWLDRYLQPEHKETHD
jgi:CRISPR-associated protein Csx17